MLRCETQGKTNLYREIFYTEYRGVSNTVTHLRSATSEALIMIYTKYYIAVSDIMGCDEDQSKCEQFFSTLVTQSHS